MADRFAAGGSGVLAFLVVSDGAAAVAFYERAFGATVAERMAAPDGRLMFCRLEINGGPLMVSDDFPEHCGGIAGTPDQERPSPTTQHMQVTDCDAVYASAIAAGAMPLMSPQDMFWGDRYARLRDPFGHTWSLGQTLAR